MQPPRPGDRLRLALDQNFPIDLLASLQEWLPEDVELKHISKIDPRMSDLDDDKLIVALRQMGWHGLITNNHKMLEVPHEIAAIVATKAVVVATVSVGHDPIRAAGMLLVELPGISQRLIANESNVFWIKHEKRKPQSAWEYLSKAAANHGLTASDLWRDLQPDVTTAVLD